MVAPTLDQIGTHRDSTDEEIKVLKHVVANDTNWVNQGHSGIVNGQVKGVEAKMTEAIIVTARVKEMDRQGFLEACGARAQGLTLDGAPGGAGGAANAVAYLLNNLDPSEANSLAGGTDVTDRAMTRAKNAIIVIATNDFKAHFSNKIHGWEESNDRSRFSHGNQYMNRVEREAEVIRRNGLTRSERAALASNHMDGPAVRKVQTAKAAKAVLGNGS